MKNIITPTNNIKIQDLINRKVWFNIHSLKRKPGIIIGYQYDMYIVKNLEDKKLYFSNILDIVKICN